MRVTTAFNRILAIPGASVTSVRFDEAGLIVVLRPRWRLLRCPCGHQARGRYDQRLRRWRHIDIAGLRVWLEAPVRRLRCQACGRVRTEEVAWARPGARHTRDVEDLVLWLAQRMDRTAVARLLRISWEAASAIIQRAVTDRLDPSRLVGVRRIGVDEVRYRYRRFLTLVVDHDTGAVIWVTEGKNAAALEAFYAAIGPGGAAAIEAVSMDLGNAYRVATERAAPQARTCIDPFHLIQRANKAVRDSIRWARRTATLPMGRQHQRLTLALAKAAGSLTQDEQAMLAGLRRQRSVIWRAWDLKEDLRGLYQLADPTLAGAYLRRWSRRAVRSRIPPMLGLARTIREHRDGIIAAIELGISNARLEGTASKVRLINHRGYGHHSIGALAAMIYLCCGTVATCLPHR